ncbi:hypothetical protein CVT26_006943 [Gymnopilus dilepis]|uniref:DUF6535 domain-containing protein n=1 Tax=Gymnopilus dilepis TaxID=231916 RepID=A0A409W6D7_9AGAR|nr:hypothetical protein CVT26_006943 [Gymnopilus dilepis]
MPGVVEESNADPLSEKPQPWLCGDPYKYPLPEEKGSPWEALLAPLLEQDRAQCDGWNDEVQNLLIFAGLFSAVLTAFVIESYKNLQPDPNDRIIDLLSQISAGVQGHSDNITLARASASDSFSPAPSSVRINAFWFTSLVLSLTTVLIGIVCLQWIREHKKYPARMAPRDKFAILYMRTEALQQWYVPEIFAALPILLQFALLLFFAGLIDFTLPFGIKIFIPVIIAAAVPVVFLFITTVLPSLQAFTFLNPLSRGLKKVPAQCPYKSPQCQILRRFMTLSKGVFNCYASISSFLHALLTGFDVGRGARQSQEDGYIVEGVVDDIRSQISDIWSCRTWENYDSLWMALRDGCAKAIFNRSRKIESNMLYHSFKTGPIYDATMGLHWVPIQNYDGQYPLSYTLYHCVADLSDAIVGPQSTLLELGANLAFRARYNLYFQNLLFEDLDLTDPCRTLTSRVDTRISGPAIPTMMHEENCLIFLAESRTPTSLIGKHLAELHIRLGHSSLSQAPVSACPDTFIPGSQSLLYADYVLSTIYAWPKDCLDDDISAQADLALHLFFRVLASPEVDEAVLLQSFHSKAQAKDFMRAAVARQPREKIKALLDYISSVLLTWATDTPGKRADLFFYCAALYAHSTITQPAIRLLDDDREISTVYSFLPILNTYLQHRGTLEAVTDFGVPADTSHEWWDVLLRGETVRSWNLDPNEYKRFMSRTSFIETLDLLRPIRQPASPV